MTPGIECLHTKLISAVNDAIDESPNDVFMALASIAIVSGFKAGAGIANLERDFGIALKRATQLMKE